MVKIAKLSLVMARVNPAPNRQPGPARTWLLIQRGKAVKLVVSLDTRRRAHVVSKEPAQSRPQLAVSAMKEHHAL